MFTICDEIEYFLGFNTFNKHARWISWYVFLKLFVIVSWKMGNIHYWQIIFEIWVLIERNIWCVSIYHMSNFSVFILPQDCRPIPICFTLSFWSRNWLQCLNTVHTSPRLLRIQFYVWIWICFRMFFRYFPKWIKVWDMFIYCMFFLLILNYLLLYFLNMLSWF